MIDTVYCRLHLRIILLCDDNIGNNIPLMEAFGESELADIIHMHNNGREPTSESIVYLHKEM